jgi:DNA repair photolyase
VRIIYREVECKSALNRVVGMPFPWSLNPYMGCAHRCAFCYVRAFEQRADRPSDERYGTDVRVKVNFVAVLRAELARRSWKREPVAIGAATDPYQPVESRYEITRRTVQALGESRTPFSIITRGPMILRDLDVLTHAAQQVRLSVHVSVMTLDPVVAERLEPGVAPPEQRLRAVRELVNAGIDAGVAVAPILPGLTDGEDDLAALVTAAREAGATRVWGRDLYLRAGTREHFLKALARGWPEQLARYAALYRGRAYLVDEVGRDLRGRVKRAAAAAGIDDRRVTKLSPVATSEPAAVAGVAEQLALPWAALPTAGGACKE